MQEEMDHAAQMSQMAQPAAAGQPAPGGQPDQGGQPAQGGQPGQPATPQQSVADTLPVDPNEKITPEELDQKAQAAASQLVGMPSSQRISELRKLKQKAPQMHAIVKEKISEIENQAKQQGGQQVLQQQYGKQGSFSLLRHRRR
jgi:hypothetical protein